MHDPDSSAQRRGERSRRPEKRLGPGVALALLTTIVFFALIEMSFRIHVFGLKAFSFDAVNSFSQNGASGLVKASDHSEIVYDLKPNLDTYFKTAIFRTNAMGLRDKEYEISKPDNTVRVVVLGDSWSMPAGVNIEDAWHSLLEEEFNRQRGERRYEFINFGVGGYALRQYAGVLKYKVPKYKPDLVIVGWCSTNDHREPASRLYDRPYEPKPAKNPFFHSFILNRHYRRGVFHGVIPGRFRSAEKYSEAQKKYMLRSFNEIHVLAKDTPVIVVYLANLYNRSHAEQAHELEKLVAGAGLHFVNPSDSDIFSEDNFARHSINPIDGHPNAATHGIFADRIHRFLGEFMTGLPTVRASLAASSVGW